jgi:hypothetical protein
MTTKIEEFCKQLHNYPHQSTHELRCNRSESVHTELARVLPFGAEELGEQDDCQSAVLVDLDCVLKYEILQEMLAGSIGGVPLVGGGIVGFEFVGAAQFALGAFPVPLEAQLHSGSEASGSV